MRKISPPPGFATRSTFVRIRLRNSGVLGKSYFLSLKNNKKKSSWDTERMHGESYFIISVEENEWVTAEVIPSILLSFLPFGTFICFIISLRIKAHLKNYTTLENGCFLLPLQQDYVVSSFGLGCIVSL